MLNANVYYMHYTDQLVLTGQIMMLAIILEEM